MSKNDSKTEIKITSPTAFEKMWGELSNMVQLASQHSFRQDIEYAHLYNVMMGIEASHKASVELEREQINQFNKSKESEKGSKEE